MNLFKPKYVRTTRTTSEQTEIDPEFEKAVLGVLKKHNIFSKNLFSARASFDAYSVEMTPQERFVERIREIIKEEKQRCAEEVKLNKEINRDEYNKKGK